MSTKRGQFAIAKPEKNVMVDESPINMGLSGALILAKLKRKVKKQREQRTSFADSDETRQLVGSEDAAGTQSRWSAIRASRATEMSRASYKAADDGALQERLGALEKAVEDAVATTAKNHTEVMGRLDELLQRLLPPSSPPSGGSPVDVRALNLAAVPEVGGGRGDEESSPLRVVKKSVEKVV